MDFLANFVHRVLIRHDQQLEHQRGPIDQQPDRNGVYSQDQYSSEDDESADEDNAEDSSVSNPAII